METIEVIREFYKGQEYFYRKPSSEVYKNEESWIIPKAIFDLYIVRRKYPPTVVQPGEIVQL